MPEHTFKVYKLHFRSGFHLDSQAYAYENSRWMIPSDTLFSAICHSLNLLYGPHTLEGLLNRGNPSFKLSSCFPFSGNHYFFPAPLKDRGFSGLNDGSSHKKLVKAALMPMERFVEDLHGHLNVREWASALEDMDKLYKEVERPRVLVDRVNNQSSIFHFAETQYMAETGLFCLVDCEDQETENKLMAAFRLLGEEGIGSDSTVGKGQFRLESDELHVDLPEAVNHYVLLSLYNPSEAELLHLNASESFYRLIVRGGWIAAGGRDLRRKSLRMLTEGSVLRYNSEKPPEGNVPVVLEDNYGLDHPVYRYGKAFCLPIIL